MGVRCEFNFEEDLELMGLKYQMEGTNLQSYFTQEIGAGEPISYIERNENQAEKIDYPNM